MAGTLMPAPWFTGLDANGHPVPGGRLYTYLAGTTTPATTYSDALLTVPNTNPVILDGAGRASVFLPASSFKFALHDANDVLIREQDFASAVPPNEIDLDVQGVAGESLGDRAVVYLAGGAGGTTPGQWYLTDADSVNTSTGVNIIGIVPQAIGAGASGAIRLQGRVDGFSGLTPGASYFISAVPGEITAVAPANARFIGIADSTTSLVLTVSGVAQAQPPDPVFNTVQVASTAATALDVAGGIQAGTGNVQIVGADGRIPAIDSTRFASLSGANLTSIPETAVADGTILARLGANETITGAWTFAGQASFGNTPTSIAAEGNAVLQADNTEANALVIIGRPLDSDSIILFRDTLNSLTFGSIHLDPDNGRMRLSAGAPAAVLVLDLGSSAITPHVRINSGAAQPGFLAYANVDTGAQPGTLATVAFGTEVFDEAGNFSANTFTAPVTGRYLLSASMQFTSSINGNHVMAIVTSNRTYEFVEQVSSSQPFTLQGSVIADMDAGDTAIVQRSGAGAIDIQGDTLIVKTYFSGRLLP